MPKILILVAHPDDETIFNSNDLLNPDNDVTVICFTNKSNKVRKTEFFKTIKIAKAKGYMLDLHDAQDNNWNYKSTEELVDMVLKKIKNQNFDLITTHDKQGEYGHIQHKRVHQIGKLLSKIINVPVKDFKTRYNNKTLNKTKRNKILYSIYKSQKSGMTWGTRFVNKHFTRKNKK